MAFHGLHKFCRICCVIVGRNLKFIFMPNSLHNCAKVLLSTWRGTHAPIPSAKTIEAEFKAPPARLPQGSGLSTSSSFIDQAAKQLFFGQLINRQQQQQHTPPSSGTGGSNSWRSAKIALTLTGKLATSVALNMDTVN